MITFIRLFLVLLVSVIIEAKAENIDVLVCGDCDADERVEIARQAMTTYCPTEQALASEGLEQKLELEGTQCSVKKELIVLNDKEELAEKFLLSKTSLSPVVTVNHLNLSSYEQEIIHEYFLFQQQLAEMNPIVIDAPIAIKNANAVTSVQP